MQVAASKLVADVYAPRRRVRQRLRPVQPDRLRAGHLKRTCERSIAVLGRAGPRRQAARTPIDSDSWNPPVRLTRTRDLKNLQCVLQSLYRILPITQVCDRLTVACALWKLPLPRCNSCEVTSDHPPRVPRTFHNRPGICLDFWPIFKFALKVTYSN